MSIRMIADVKRLFGFGKQFFMGETPVYIPLNGKPVLFRETGGYYLDVVRGKVAQQHWDDFHSDKTWKVWNAARDIAKAVSLKFDMDESLSGAFDDLWVLSAGARKYESDQKKEIKDDLANAYRYAAQLAYGQQVRNAPCFGRVLTRNDENVVIFSDFHMTAFKNLPNYFQEFNYELYLEVLDYYAATDFCLVEAGDVEDCLVFEPDAAEARARLDAAPKQGREIVFPVVSSGYPNWGDFLTRRYKKREKVQDDIIRAFPDYYERARNFVRRGKYVRLAGNHDTYLEDTWEDKLRQRITTELTLDVDEVFDALQLMRSTASTNDIRYLVMHGHQFDDACMQHGAVAYAKSLGEMYTECLSWGNQGADRIWRDNDTKRWYIGAIYPNALARSLPGDYPGILDPESNAQVDLATNAINSIMGHSQEFFETLMGHQIGWEYFKNADGFNAFTLEVWTGEQMYKLKHLDEISLVEAYESEFNKLNKAGKPLPKLVVGHSHEPRQRATYHTHNGNAMVEADCYLNSGSAGRYENLIWGIEIQGLTDRVISWSKIDGKLTRICWKSDHGTLVHTPCPPGNGQAGR